MNPSLSIIICTFNPKKYIFEPCLVAISNICLTQRNLIAEIIVVDNNSNNSFFDEGYVQLFLKLTSAKFFIEKEQGLTPARLRGIKESSSDILLFLDDDNYIPNNFISAGIKIAIQNPHIGAWSGQINLIYEKQPEIWLHKYRGMLVHREFDRDSWSNNPLNDETMPCGAGLFVRREVANYYLKLNLEGKRIIKLDRSGSSLFSGGDNDLAACACDLGMGLGLFKDIKLIHFIPSNRITLSYMLKLAEGIAASSIVFKSFRGQVAKKPSLKNIIANTIRLILKSRIDRRFFYAVIKGERLGREILAQNQQQ